MQTILVSVVGLLSLTKKNRLRPSSRRSSYSVGVRSSLKADFFIVKTTKPASKSSPRDENWANSNGPDVT